MAPRALRLLAALMLILAAPPALAQSAGIVAVVNGDIITTFDVESRRRLFAATAGLPLTPEVLDRITPQVRRLLVDERLRLQEAQRRRIPVTDAEIATAIARIERQNRLPEGGLRANLARQGIDVRALYAQLRATIAWAKLVRAELGPQADIDPEQVRQRIREIEAATGQPEFLVSEIFIAVDDPSQEREAERTAADLIDQLRRGAPFAAVAAQFSQAQSAEEGGDLGWVRLGQLEPEVEAVLTQMPVGAISLPIRTAGGYTVVTLRGRREVGRDIATLLTLRQAFLPFDAILDPRAPTPQQIRTLETARRISETARSCDAFERQVQASPGARLTVPPGDVRLDEQPAELQRILNGLSPGRPSEPLIAPDGIVLFMVCNRRQENLAIPTPEAVAETILRERVDLLSRQMMRDLRRRADIEFRA
ncbi:peptidylprolyl isomerase [Elioraea thermophila]|uniref:peptidylprolyl isomerase n=1 Tax=Elioraea thermophila TaxID=2185104 RepID=UPI000DF12D31|nr:peptidylprolyl isomerase [Elioraea thermophila]